MKKTKMEKGITLIALIITIIILLILAVVTIGSIKNSNIIKYAQNATYEHEVGQEKENIQLAIGEARLMGNGTLTKSNLQSALDGIFKGNVDYTDLSSEDFIKIKIKPANREYKIDLDGKVEGPLSGSAGGENDNPEDDSSKEILITDLIVVDASGNEQKEAGTILSGSLYIQFKATLEGGTIDSVTVGGTPVTSAINECINYEVTANGTYEFTIKGTANGTEYTKTVSIEVNQFKVKEAIPTTTTYIGYYADVDGNGSVDGIIYVDLAVDGSGRWNDDNGVYSYSKKEILNNYYISQESYQYKNFAEKPVIAPIDTEEENDRFYVMALENFTTEDYTTFYWYYNAYSSKMSDYAETTSVDFGKGKANTLAMMNKVYGAGLIDRDVWKHIGSEVEKGWFVPSEEEWAVFGDLTTKLGVTTSNYTDYGLSANYWSSSQLDKTFSSGASFVGPYGCIFYSIVERRLLSAFKHDFLT